MKEWHIFKLKSDCCENLQGIYFPTFAYEVLILTKFDILSCLVISNKYTRLSLTLLIPPSKISKQNCTKSKLIREKYNTPENFLTIYSQVLQAFNFVSEFSPSFVDLCLKTVLNIWVPFKTFVTLLIKLTEVEFDSWWKVKILITNRRKHRPFC